MLRIDRLACLFLIAGVSLPACNSQEPTTTDPEQSAPSELTAEPSPAKDETEAMKPPQEAFDACSGLAEGAACSVSIHDHKIDGTCRKGPKGEAELACAPAKMDGPPPGPPPGARRGPPQEALDACKTLAEGAACSVTFHEKKLDGTCRKGPRGEAELACAPAKMDGPPPGPPPGARRGPPQEALDACKTLAEGAACSVTFHEKKLDGTCRKGPKGEAELACAPSKMDGPPPGSPPGARRGPPQEAFDACKTLAEGAACSVTFHERKLDGTCRKGPRGEAELACAPARPHGPPAGM